VTAERLAVGIAFLAGAISALGFVVYHYCGVVWLVVALGVLSFFIGTCILASPSQKEPK
jgi:hypothetical protein